MASLFCLKFSQSVSKISPMRSFGGFYFYSDKNCGLSSLVTGDLWADTDMYFRCESLSE